MKKIIIQSSYSALMVFIQNASTAFDIKRKIFQLILSTFYLNNLLFYIRFFPW